MAMWLQDSCVLSALFQFSSAAGKGLVKQCFEGNVFSKAHVNLYCHFLNKPTGSFRVP